MQDEIFLDKIEPLDPMKISDLSRRNSSLNHTDFSKTIFGKASIKGPIWNTCFLYDRNVRSLQDFT